MRNRFGTTAVLLAGALLVAAATAGCAGGGPASSADRALEVLRATAEENPDYRVYMLDVASRSGAPATGELLLEAASAKPYDIASSALHGLVARRVDGGAAALAPVFEAKRGALKVTAALALANQGDAAAIDWLAESLADEQQNLGPEVAVALARAGREDVAQTYLAGEVASDDERRRDAAYVALGEIGTDWARAMLTGGLDREHGERRESAIVGIGLAGDRGSVAKIKKFVNTQGLVTATLEALGRLGGDAAIETLRGELDHEEALVRAYAAAGLLRNGVTEGVDTAIAALAADEDSQVRQLLAVRLADVEQPLARTTLATLATDADPAVRLEAMRGLLKVGTSEQRGVVAAAVDDEDYQVRAVALETLGRVGTPDDVDAILVPLFDDANPYVRIAAAAAAIEIDARAGAA